MVQGTLDPDCALVHRALDLCVMREPGATVAVLAVAADRHPDVVCGQYRLANRSMDAVCRGLDDGAGRDVSYQPLRPVRPASSLVAPDWKAVHASALSHSITLSLRPSSALFWLPAGVLDDTNDDAGASTVRMRNNRLYHSCDSVRGTRPCLRTRRRIRAVPARRSHADTRTQTAGRVSGSACWRLSLAALWSVKGKWAGRPPIDVSRQFRIRRGLARRSRRSRSRGSPAARAGAPCRLQA